MEYLMSFGLYLLGCVFVIAGIAWALVSAGVSYSHVAMVSLVLVGLGVLSGVARTRGRDKSNTPPN